MGSIFVGSEKGSGVHTTTDRFRITFMAPRIYDLAQIDLSRFEITAGRVIFAPQPITRLSAVVLDNHSTLSELWLTRIIEVINLNTGEIGSTLRLMEAAGIPPSSSMSAISIASASPPIQIMAAEAAILFLSSKLGRMEPRDYASRHIAAFEKLLDLGQTTESERQATPTCSTEKDYRSILAELPHFIRRAAKATAMNVARGTGRRQLPDQITAMIERDFTD